MSSGYIAVHILQRIYGSEERGGYIAEDTLQRIYCSAERGEGVEQDLCKALAATNLCSADSQSLPYMRISIARRCTN